jgi:DNA-binding NtrC family response regulator
MHYLASLSNKLVATYQNQEDILNSTNRRIDYVDTRILAEAVQAVLEQEIEKGRLRYDLLHEQHEDACLSALPEPFFAEILSHRG